MKGQEMNFDSFFRPESIAIIGAISGVGKVGHNFITNLIELKFPGKIYPVHHGCYGCDRPAGAYYIESVVFIAYIPGEGAIQYSIDIYCQSFKLMICRWIIIQETLR